MEARGAAGSAATRRCVRRPRLQRARCDFVDFFRCTPRDLGPIGHGAPPQAHIHLNLEVYISGSPRTKFGVFVTVCNRRFHMLDHLFGASLSGALPTGRREPGPSRPRETGRDDARPHGRDTTQVAHRVACSTTVQPLKQGLSPRAPIRRATCVSVRVQDHRAPTTRCYRVVTQTTHAELSRLLSSTWRSAAAR